MIKRVVRQTPRLQLRATPLAYKEKGRCCVNSGNSGVNFFKRANKWRAVKEHMHGKAYSKSFKTKEEVIEYRAELERIHLYYFITDKRKNKKKDEYNNKCY